MGSAEWPRPLTRLEWNPFFCLFKNRNIISQMGFTLRFMCMFILSFSNEVCILNQRIHKDLLVQEELCVCVKQLIIYMGNSVP